MTVCRHSVNFMMKYIDGCVEWVKKGVCHRRQVPAVNRLLFGVRLDMLLSLLYAVAVLDIIAASG